MNSKISKYLLHFLAGYFFLVFTLPYAVSFYNEIHTAGNFIEQSHDTSSKGKELLLDISELEDSSEEDSGVFETLPFVITYFALELFDLHLSAPVASHPLPQNTHSPGSVSLQLLNCVFLI